LRALNRFQQLSLSQSHLSLPLHSSGASFMPWMKTYVNAFGRRTCVINKLEENYKILIFVGILKSREGSGSL
jgi:hypothetical protein